jgi:hypothetical protein
VNLKNSIINKENMKSKNISTIILSLLLGGFITKAQELPEDRVELVRVNNKFIQNWITVDSASHSKIIHSDFIGILSNGQFIGRKEYLKEWVNSFAYNPTVLKDFTHGLIELRIFGNYALVVGYTKYQVKNSSGTWIKKITPYTDTYVKTNGKWLCVQVQLTPLTGKEFYY